MSDAVTLARSTPIAIVGGTGALGSGLALRLARAQFPVIIGSRTADKAIEGAKALGHGIEGMSNEAAARAASIVIVTVPWSSQAAILNSIRSEVTGKLVVDTTVPLNPPKVARVELPPQGSAALAAQAALGEGVRLISGFHNVAAAKLPKPEAIDCDVLIFGDAPADRAIGIELAKAIGLRGVHGGPLANSAAAEALTSVLISINRSYKADGAGLRITGLPG